MPFRMLVSRVRSRGLGDYVGWARHPPTGLPLTILSTKPIQCGTRGSFEYIRGRCNRVFFSEGTWARGARLAYLKLRLDGQGLEARDALRNRMRPCAGPVQRRARQTLEMLLDRSENAPGEPGDNDRHPRVGVTDWVEYVVTGWHQMAGVAEHVSGGMHSDESGIFSW